MLTESVGFSLCRRLLVLDQSEMPLRVCYLAAGTVICLLFRGWVINEKMLFELGFGVYQSL
jgi:hypothetical protein